MDYDADAVDETVTPLPRAKRPGWVWAISIFFALSAVWTYLSFYLVLSGAVPLNAAQEAYIESLTTFDRVCTVALGMINISAAASLFLLRKVAFYLFVLGLMFNISLTTWHIASKGWAAAIGNAGLVGFAIGLVTVAAVCAYSWRLVQRGILQ